MSEEQIIQFIKAKAETSAFARRIAGSSIGLKSLASQLSRRKDMNKGDLEALFKQTAMMA